MKPHKHAELIKAWADGAEIEVSSNLTNWTSVYHPNWHLENARYRIKPQKKSLGELLEVACDRVGTYQETAERFLKLVKEHGYDI